MEKINVLSLFDGMSCGQIALNRVGIEYNQYFASEIDKHAIKVTQHNYPLTVQLGDVCKVKGYTLPQIDLLLGGSPCQGFSFAGKGLNFEDPRSKLFFEYVRILNELKETNPNVKFLLENVRMKEEWRDVISRELGVEPIFIDSALVSAQTRKRLYWTNIEGVTQPEDRQLMLQDILEDGVVDRQKDFCLDASYFKGGNMKQYLEKNRRQLIFQLPRGNNPGGLKALNGKVPSMTSSDWQYNNLVLQVNPSVESGGKQPYMQNRVYHPIGKSVALTQFCNRLNVADLDGLSHRKLTPIECERLQTVPDGYTEGASNSQRYKMLGNGWTVDVIVHILKFLV